MVAALPMLLAASSALLLGPACPASRLACSRVASFAPARPATVCMCDAAEPADEPAAAAAPAEPAAEEAAAAPKGKGKGKKKVPLEDLVVGSTVEGKVRSVVAYGAFIDVGASTDGLLHVSEISNEFVKDANEKLKAGEAISCRVKSIDLEKGQLALSCKDESAGGGGGGKRRGRPDLKEYESSDPKAFIKGTVNSITDYGAFVTLKPGVDGLVHISAIQEGNVDKVTDVLTAGQEVEVRVVEFDKSKRRIGLSMLPYKEGEEEERKKGGGRGRGGGGRGGSGGFGDDDAPFKMNDAELEELTVGDDFVSPFDAAFARAKFVSEKKEKKEKYAPQLL